MSARLFPGDRRVWLAGGGVAAAVLAVLLGFLIVPRPAYTGSNSVAARDAFVVVSAKQQFCMRRVRVPAGTGQVQFSFDTRTDPTPRIRLRIHTADGRTIRGVLPASATTGLRRADIPIATTPASPASVEATICISPQTATIFPWGRAQVPGNQLPPLLDGAPVNGRASIWFRPPAGHDRRSILSQVPQIFQRASLFRPGGIGAWTYWVLFLAVFPLLVYGALRLLANADLPRRRRVPLWAWVALITFVHAAGWSIVSPVFQTPDEPEHFAYAQYLAETGRAVDATPGPRAVYSSAETMGLEATRMQSVIERAQAKVPWLAAEEGTWRARHDATKPRAPQDNGGGSHPATSPHSPAYYALLAPAYGLTRHHNVFTQVTALRLTSAIMGALTALFGFLLVLELLPGRRGLAVAGGLFVGLEPMFGFISGAVNNDNGVNVGSALLILLVVRALRRGLSRGLAAGIGVTLAVTPLLKGTGYELYPPVVLALLAYLVQRHGRGDFARLGGAVAAFAVTYLTWDQVSTHFHRTTFTTPGGGTPGTSFGALHHLSGYLSWMWQVLVPVRLPFMTDFTIVHWPFFNIYVREGFGAFGWYAIYFHQWVYVVIAAVGVILIVLAAAFLWDRRGLLSRRWPEVMFLALVPVTVVFAVDAAYFTLAGLPLNGTAEQGRYGFPAITAVAVIAIAGCAGTGRRRALPVAAGLCAALLGLIAASWALTLSTFYA